MGNIKNSIIKMGNDGGDIPRRKQLVKEKAKIEVVSAETIARSRARFCAFTNSKFKQPLAVCRLGCIYNYESILEAIAKKTLPQKFSYIRKLTDIKKIKIQKTIEKSDNFFLCPITKQEYNGFNKFVCIWKCGHVMSKRAFKEVKINDAEKNKKCIICDTEYEAEDVVDLNLQNAQLEKKRNELIKKVMFKEQKKREKQSARTNSECPEGEPRKKVKLDIHVSPLDRLGGEFRDVLRQREKFKQIFSKKTA